MSCTKRLSMLAPVLALLLAAAEAHAQGPVRRPPPSYVPGPSFSPYLNLLRRDVPQAVNYYGIVRPEFEFRQGIMRVDERARTNQQSIQELQTTSLLPPTGHTTYFLNGSHPFFGQAGVGGPGTRPVAAGGFQPITAPARTASPTPAPTGPSFVAFTRGRR